jgi:hypothetical protein
MPSIKFHISRSISSPEKARAIHEALDNIHGLPFFTPKIHGKVRQLTHNIPTAIFIGYKLNGNKGIRDALNHLIDDIIYNKMFYGMKVQREQEKEYEATTKQAAKQLEELEDFNEEEKEEEA